MYMSPVYIICGIEIFNLTLWTFINDGCRKTFLKRKNENHGNESKRTVGACAHIIAIQLVIYYYPIIIKYQFVAI